MQLVLKLIFAKRRSILTKNKEEWQHLGKSKWRGFAWEKVARTQSSMCRFTVRPRDAVIESWTFDENVVSIYGTEQDISIGFNVRDFVCGSSVFFSSESSEAPIWRCRETTPLWRPKSQSFDDGGLCCTRSEWKRLPDADFNSIQSSEGTHWAGRAQDAARFLAEAATFRWVQECNKKGVGPLFMDVFGHYEQKAFGSTVDITREIWFLNCRRATTHFSNLPSILKFHYKTCIDRLYVIGPTPLPSHDAAWTPSTCSSCSNHLKKQQFLYLAFTSLPHKHNLVYTIHTSRMHHFPIIFFGFWIYAKGRLNQTNFKSLKDLKRSFFKVLDGSTGVSMFTETCWSLPKDDERWVAWGPQAMKASNFGGPWFWDTKDPRF